MVFIIVSRLEGIVSIRHFHLFIPEQVAFINVSIGVAAEHRVSVHLLADVPLHLIIISINSTRLKLNKFNISIPFLNIPIFPINPPSLSLTLTSLCLGDGDEFVYQSVSISDVNAII